MKAFIIKSNNELSTLLANDCIEAAYAFGLNVQPWIATNGATDGLRKMADLGLTTFLSKSIKNRLGVLGCFISHYELWIKCIELDESIIILEHDGFMLRPLPSDINDHYSDVLVLDPFKPSSDQYDTLLSNSSQAPIDYYDPPADKQTKYGDFVFGAYAYCIKPAAAEKLTSFARTTGILPTDVHIHRPLVDIKSTTVPIFRLHAFYNPSNIISASSTTNIL